MDRPVGRIKIVVERTEEVEAHGHRRQEVAI
jgi:hypothetical protein